MFKARKSFWKFYLTAGIINISLANYFKIDFWYSVLLAFITAFFAFRYQREVEK